MSLDENEKEYLKLLVNLMFFENSLSISEFLKSEGYYSKLKTYAGQIADATRILIEQEEDIKKKLEESGNCNYSTSQVLNRIDEWVSDESKSYPFDNLEVSNEILFSFLDDLKYELIRFFEMKEELFKSYFLIRAERFVRPFAKWWGRLPFEVMVKDPEILIREDSLDSICVVGDIRRSQDLMTYARDPDEFKDFMVKFLTITRKLVFDHFGVFDKFTGDGFIAYFAKSVCEVYEKDYIDCFAEFIKNVLTSTKPIFDEWKSCIRKLPPESVGLALGADTGKLFYRMEENHFIAMGDAIVWATRMANEAKAEELVVNNQLYHLIKDREDLICRSEIIGETKSGENFKAHKAFIPEYIEKRLKREL